ncbi:MAG: hypothetical protein WBO12_04140 [Xanthobacteraceae bacterium]
MSTLTDDYGAEFAAHSDSLAYRTIGIYVFLRTVMSSPVRASQIRQRPPLFAAALKVGQGNLGSTWLAQSGRADRSLDPEGSTDRFDTRALKRRF